MIGIDFTPPHWADRAVEVEPGGKATPVRYWLSDNGTYIITQKIGDGGHVPRVHHTPASLKHWRGNSKVLVVLKDTARPVAHRPGAVRKTAIGLLGVTLSALALLIIASVAYVAAWRYCGLI